MKLLVMQSSPLSCYPVLLSPNIFLSALFLNTLNGCCTINMRLMKNNPKVETVTKCSSSAHRAHFNASTRCLQLVKHRILLSLLLPSLWMGGFLTVLTSTWISNRNLCTVLWRLRHGSFLSSRSSSLGRLFFDCLTLKLGPTCCCHTPVTITNVPGKWRPRLHRIRGLKSSKYTYFWVESEVITRHAFPFVC